MKAKRKGVVPNLYINVTISETNNGTQQDSASVEVTGLGKAGVLFRESSGPARYTGRRDALDHLSTNPKLDEAPDSIPLICREIVASSISSDWQQIQQLIGLRLELCRRRNLLEGGAGWVGFQTVGHPRAAG